MVSRLAWALALPCALIASLPSTASAREQSFAYPYGRVWETTVRMLRVDFNTPITEKDRDDGYFFFEYENDGKRYPGSVQVVRAREGQHDVVRVVIQVPAMPSYVEQMMLDRLERKLGKEHGEPMLAKDAPAKPASPKVKDSAQDGEPKGADGASKGADGKAKTSE